MPLGPHGHEKVGIEVLRVLCPKCGNRVSLEPNEVQAKCGKCGTTVKRPKGARQK
jgi:ribosomal protein S27AE